MKFKVYSAFAAFAVAASVGCTSARSEVLNELSRSGDDLSRLIMRPDALPFLDGATLPARADSNVLGLSLMRSHDESAPVEGAMNSAPVVPPASLMRSDQQGALLSQGGERTGSGFATIRAAMTGHGQTEDLLSHSTEDPSRFYRYSPPK